MDKLAVFCLVLKAQDVSSQLFQLPRRAAMLPYMMEY